VAAPADAGPPGVTGGEPELWPRVVAAYPGCGTYQRCTKRHPTGHLRAALTARCYRGPGGGSVRPSRPVRWHPVWPGSCMVSKPWPMP